MGFGVGGFGGRFGWVGWKWRQAVEGEQEVVGFFEDVEVVLGGAVCKRDEDARVVRDDVKALRAKTTLMPDAAVNRDEVLIEARLKNGSTVKHHVEHARGSLARPLTDDELMDKVRLLVDPHLGDGTAARLGAIVAGLDSAPNLDALSALCVPNKESNHA